MLMARPLLCVTVTAADDGRAAPPARRRRRRRPRRAAARLGQRSGRRRRAGRPAPPGHRHLPADVGRRRRSRARKKSGSGSSARRSRSAPSTSTSSGARGFDDLIAQTGGRRIVLSTHDFDGVPARPRRRACRRCERPAPRSSRSRSTATGLQRLRAAARARRASGRRRRAGADRRWATTGWRRACSPARFGSRVDLRRGARERRPADARRRCWTTTASARISRCDRGLRRRRRAGRALGLAGDAQRRVSRARGIDAVYLPLPAAERRRLPDVRRARSASAAPASRFRSRWRCSSASTRSIAVARRIGAINTIRVVDGRWIGGNTDVDGFPAAAAASGVPLAGLRAAVLGAGGAARAVAVALASSGCQVRVHARNRAQAEEVAALDVGAASGRGRRSRAAGICWSTARRRHVPARRRDAARRPSS